MVKKSVIRSGHSCAIILPKQVFENIKDVDFQMDTARNTIIIKWGNL